MLGRTNFRAAGAQLEFSRSVSRKIAMAQDVHLSSRRVMRKIKMGKARPAIFHQFETLVELSDGSVIKRRSQAPKDEIRLISDQKNSPLWNPHRSDLTTADPNATGRVNQFKKRFSQFEEPAEPTEKSSASESSKSRIDSLIDLMGHNVQEVQKGGRVLDKKKRK